MVQASFADQGRDAAFIRLKKIKAGKGRCHAACNSLQHLTLGSGFDGKRATAGSHGPAGVREESGRSG